MSKPAAEFITYHNEDKIGYRNFYVDLFLDWHSDNGGK